MSVAGGLPLAVDRAVLHGGEALQIFAKNASQWQGRSPDASEVREFRNRVERSGIDPVVSHASYLINLATPDPTLHERSEMAIADEVDRAEALGLLGVVLHPGCHTHGDREGGLARLARSLVQVLNRRRQGRTIVLLEHTAGQGTSLGATFEEIAAILSHAGGHPRLGVCLDTCHLLAAGYDIASEAGYTRTCASFARLIGFDRLKVFHVNDSKTPLGSHVDRHTHIGEGHVGLDGFRRLVTDRRFGRLPMLLETPKASGRKRAPSTVAADAWDERNLETLRRLARTREKRTSGGRGQRSPKTSASNR